MGATFHAQLDAAERAAADGEAALAAEAGRAAIERTLLAVALNDAERAVSQVPRLISHPHRALPAPPEPLSPVTCRTCGAHRARRLRPSSRGAALW